MKIAPGFPSRIPPGIPSGVPPDIIPGLSPLVSAEVFSGICFGIFPKIPLLIFFGISPLLFREFLLETPGLCHKFFQNVLFQEFLPRIPLGIPCMIIIGMIAPETSLLAPLGIPSVIPPGSSLGTSLWISSEFSEFFH